MCRFYAWEKDGLQEGDAVGAFQVSGWEIQKFGLLWFIWGAGKPHISHNQPVGPLGLEKVMWPLSPKIRHRVR